MLAAQIIRERAEAIRNVQIAEAQTTQEKYHKIDVKKVLDVYQHESKSEDARYTTSSNEIGRKTPTTATFVGQRMARNQAFSNSFGGAKPRNTALNTSLSRSNVHPSLDQTFL